MPTYEVKLKDRQLAAEGTMAFHFEKPPEFTFKAGQSIDLTLINPPQTDAEGNARTFTIASAPSERDLMVATRMRDTAFKRVLKAMPLETPIKIDGPYGALTLHKDSARPGVFLAGGIGITPFLSMLRQATRDKFPHRLSLFYSNRRPEDAAFLDELQRMEKQNRNYQFIGTMTEMAKSNRPWDGETGYVNKEMLVKRLKELTGPVYYTAGPPAMVAAMRKMLNDAGVDDDNIRSEDFVGY